MKFKKTHPIISRLHLSFWMGWMTCGACMLLYQDFIGKEEYLVLLDKHWVDIYWMVWLPIMVSAIAFYLIGVKRTKQELLWAKLKNEEVLVNVSSKNNAINKAAVRPVAPPPPGSRPPPPPRPPRKP